MAALMWFCWDAFEDHDLGKPPDKVLWFEPEDWQYQLVKPMIVQEVHLA